MIVKDEEDILIL